MEDNGTNCHNLIIGKTMNPLCINLAYLSLVINTYGSSVDGSWPRAGIPNIGTDSSDTFLGKTTKWHIWNNIDNSSLVDPTSRPRKSLEDETSTGILEGSASPYKKEERPIFRKIETKLTAC